MNRSIKFQMVAGTFERNELIRKQAKEGRTQAELASEFKLTQARISQICKGQEKDGRSTFNKVFGFLKKLYLRKG